MVLPNRHCKQVGPEPPPGQKPPVIAAVVHLAALSAVGAGYPAGIPVLGGGAPPPPPAPVVPPALVVPAVPPAPPLPPAPPVAVLPPAAEVPPVPDVPPVPVCWQVSMHRAQMSDGTIRSVAQHAHAQTVSVHWPSTGIGTFSSEEQVHLSPPRLASHCAMAVYCALHFVMALTVASAAFTQAVWQSAALQSIGCDAHIAVQAWSRVRPVPEPPAALPPDPVFPAAPPAPPDRDAPPAAPPVAPLPPLATVPPDPTEPPVAVAPPPGATPPVAIAPPVAERPPLADVPPPAEAPPFAVTPPVAVDPPTADLPPEPGDPPLAAGVPPLLPCEQAIRPTSVASANVEKQRVVFMVILS